MTRIITTIEVPLDDFVRCNKSMLKLLLALYKKGGELPTIRLYNAAHTSNNYSYLGLQRAERLGYITRKKIPKPKGLKGNDMIVNSLTSKGRALLKTLNIE
jgi:hypothetical protein